MSKKNKKKDAVSVKPKERVPSYVRDLLKPYFQGIDMDDPERGILICTETDMNGSMEFSKGHIVLCKDRLFVLESEPVPGEVHFFKGRETLASKAQTVKREWTVKEYSLADMKEVKIERTVGGGFLVLVHKNPDDGEADGAAETIASFSNHRMGQTTKVERLCEKISKGEEIKDDEDDEKEEEYCPICGMMYPDEDRKICPKCMNKKSILFRTLGYLKPYRGRIAMMMLCILIYSGLNIVWPYLNGKILYDKVLGKNEAFLARLGIPGGKYVLALGLVVLTMLGTKILMQLFGILQGVITAKIVPDLVRTLKTDVFSSMGKLSVSFFTSKQTGSLMTRVMSDADEVTGFFIDGLPYFLVNVCTIVAMAVVMFMLSPVLAVAALIFTPIVFLISWKMLPRLWHRYGRRHRATRSLNSKVHDNLQGARVVKAFGQEESEVGRFDKSNEKVRSADMAVMNYDNKFFALYSMAENLASLTVNVVGAFLILKVHSLSLGVLITFTGYVSQLTGPMDFMSFFFRWYTNCMNSAQRMFEIIDAIPEIQEKPDAIKLDHIDGTVEMKHVTFGYEKHKPVLKDVSLKVKSGEMLGIVGRSGAGKTTIVNLISRLYDPQEGQVLLDGYDVRDLSFETLRGYVAMVSQETYMFMGTVAENIAYARKDATREEIIRAAVLASAHDFICRMPDGYDTIIGSSGRELSGGERQRISIARAILANPKILILDEATAAVDTETEQAIQQSINLLIKGRTTISIAHRLSTLRDANTLVVIDEGKVAEEGTHEELIAKKGTYYKLKELQTKALALKGIE
ncbi:MAG: ABC transporter ATP-binding protein [Lachnospiraceae bacterium]|nr:ABC transporter ATP-binding protein [Lachnospiraceae bacterium]